MRSSELLWAFLPLAHRLGDLRAHRVRARARAPARRSRLRRSSSPLRPWKRRSEEQTGALGRAAGGLRRALEAAVQRTTDADRKVALSTGWAGCCCARGGAPRRANSSKGSCRWSSAPGRTGWRRAAGSTSATWPWRSNVWRRRASTDEAALHIRRAKSPRAAGPSFTALGAVALALGNYLAALAYYEQGQRRWRAWRAMPT